MDPHTLVSCYRLVGELLLHPRDRDEGRVERLVESSAGAPGPVRELLCDFLSREEAWSEDEYVQTLELSPPCPLYLGAYLFDEPTSCRGAGTSGRNGYMIDLVNLYRHFGFDPAGGELPDYLPLMVDFLWISLSHADRDRIGLRRHYVERYLLPGLEPLKKALEKYESPYARVVAALRLALEHDPAFADDTPRWDPPRTVPHGRGRKVLPVVSSGEVR